VPKERVVFLHVDYVESIFPLSLGEEFEVEPVSIPFGVDIVLKDQIELFNLIVLKIRCFLEGVNQVSTLEF
jgi:hypothetical protein